MIEKIENKQILDILKEASSKQSERSGRPAGNLADASLQISHESLIEQMKQVPSEDTNVVEEARRLLLSGQLDTPENIRSAAEAIAKFGV